MLFTVFSLFLFSLVSAQYKSRPDLSPSSLSIDHTDNSKVHGGYIFTAPWETGSLPSSASGVGPHIHNNNGWLIWTGYGSIPNINSNFTPRPDRYGGSNVISYWTGTASSIGTGYGNYWLMNDTYQVFKTNLSNHIYMTFMNLCLLVNILQHIVHMKLYNRI